VQILLVFLSIFFSIVSTAMMSYLAMSTQLGPWVAPVFVVVCMVLAMPLTSKDWFKKYVIVTIAAGSIGGMVGTCLGLTWPAFYFLHERVFELSMKSPLTFASNVSMFVFCAGLPAFVAAYFFKDYLIVHRKLPFPMSKLIHDGSRTTSFIFLECIIVCAKSIPAALFAVFAYDTNAYFYWICSRKI
jgi:hypothetical protein